MSSQLCSSDAEACDDGAPGVEAHHRWRTPAWTGGWMTAWSL